MTGPANGQRGSGVNSSEVWKKKKEGATYCALLGELHINVNANLVLGLLGELLEGLMR